MPLLPRLQPAVTSRLACLYRKRAKPAMLLVLLAYGHASGLALKNIKRHMIKEQQTLITGLAMHFHPYSIAHSVLHRYRRAVVKCRRNLHDRRDRSWTPLSACAGRHRRFGPRPPDRTMCAAEREPGDAGSNVLNRINVPASDPALDHRLQALLADFALIHLELAGKRRRVVRCSGILPDSARFLDEGDGAEPRDRSQFCGLRGLPVNRTPAPSKTTSARPVWPHRCSCLFPYGGRVRLKPPPSTIFPLPRRAAIPRETKLPLPPVLHFVAACGSIRRLPAMDGKASQRCDQPGRRAR